MRKNLHAFSWILLLFALLFVVSCKNTEDDSNTSASKVSTYDREVIVKWNNVFLEVERYAAGYRPGPAPRALGLLGLATYEACITGMPEYRSVAALYPGLDIPKPDPAVDYHWPSVINAVHAFLTKRFFALVSSDKTALITALESQLNAKYKQDIGDARWEVSKNYGEFVANAVWEWSKTDTYGHDAYTDPFGSYKWEDHFDGDGDWRPNDPGPGKPMFPNWGKVRTFAISEADKLCPAPLEYSDKTNSSIYAQALEVYAQSAPTQSYTAKWIGEFWSDDLVSLTFSPGPRWIAIANQVYDLEKCNLETAVFCNTKVGMALNDAAVSCWHSKYYYNYERPESYIKRLIDANWEPPLNNPTNGQTGFTPPFPAYPSGHSTMGAAGAEALSSVFGYSYAMTDNCHKNRTEFIGVPRSFNSFYEMAEENAWSRVPLGVHFRMDAEAGVNLGYVCGRRVNALPWKK